jgi:hypothetical protein
VNNGFTVVSFLFFSFLSRAISTLEEDWVSITMVQRDSPVLL